MTEVNTKSLPESAYAALKSEDCYLPIVPAEANVPELTARSIVWGTVFCVIFTLASAYTAKT